MSVMTARARSFDQSLSRRLVSKETSRPAAFAASTARVAGVAGACGNRQADAGEMHDLCAGDVGAIDVGRTEAGSPPSLCGRSGRRAPFRLGDEVDGGRRRGIDLDRAGVDTLGPPQIEEHPAVGVVTEGGHVAGPRALPSGGDDEVRRVAAETLQVLSRRCPPVWLNSIIGSPMAMMSSPSPVRFRTRRQPMASAPSFRAALSGKGVLPSKAVNSTSWA